MDFDTKTETITPINSTVLTVDSTGALLIPRGTTAQRPGTPVAGMLRLSTTGYTAGTTIEYYDGTAASWEFMVDSSAILGVGNSVVVDNVAGTVTITNTGAGSGTNFNYNARTNTQANANPGVGNVVWNNVTLTSATQLYVAAIDGNGVDQSPFYNTVTVGAQIYIQDKNVSSSFQRWAVTSITNNTGWYTFGVTLINSNNASTWPNNHKIYLALSGSSNVTSFQTSLSGLTPSTATQGVVTLAGTLGFASGGTGLTTLGTASQILGVNTGGTGLEYKTIIGGSGITVTPAAGSLTIAASIGGVLTFNYNARTNNQANANPGNGNLVWNNAVLTSATQLYISATDSNGVDQSVLFNLLTTNNIFYVQDAVNSTIFQRWQVNSVTNNTGWYTIGVTLLSSAGFASMSNNRNIYLGWGTVGSVVSSVSGGTTGLTPNTPTTGAVTLAGTLGVANGGTGLSTTPTNGQLDIGNGTGFTRTTLTAGTGVSVTNGSGTITLANTGVTSLAGTANQITASAATGAITLSTPSAFIAPGSVQVTTTLLQTQSAALTAAGATQGTATSAPSRYNIVTTVAAGTGVILPLPVTPFGNEIYVANRGANPLNVYPNTGAAIVNGAVNAPVVIPVGQEATFVCTSTTQWWTTESVLTAGANITLTPSGGVLTIASTGGSTTPAAPTNSVQWNNAGAFGGSASFLFTPGANPFATIQGTTATNQIRIGPAFTAPGLAAQYAAGGTSTVYIETDGTNQDGQLVYFNNGGSAAVSGYIGYAYDTAAPYIRIVDADDDAPYITFNTIGTGTISNPLYVSAFGARGTNASRTLGNNSGFSWYVGANTSASALITANTPVMELDTDWLRLPTGTTASRPATPILGMIRYNSTTSRLETYDTTTVTPLWTSLMGVIDKSTVPVTATTVASTTLYSYSVPGGTLGTDGILRLTLEGNWTSGGGTRTCTVLVSYGGTTMWSAVTPTLAANSVLGWQLKLNLAAANSVTAQSLTGEMGFGPVGAPITGTTGTLTATDFAAAGIYGTAAFNSATAGTLQVTVVFSSATTAFVKRFHTLERL